MSNSSYDLNLSGWFLGRDSHSRMHLSQAILAGMLTGLQGDIRCKVLVAHSTVKLLELELA